MPIKNNSTNIAYVVLLVVIMIISAIPSIILLPILGDINLIFVASLWILYFVGLKYLSNRLLIYLIIMFSILMSIPPNPNYFVYTNEGNYKFMFIGFQNIFDEDAWSKLVFFVYYLLVLLAGKFAYKKIRQTVTG